MNVKMDTNGISNDDIKTIRFSSADVKAFLILARAGEIYTGSTQDIVTFTDAGNMIIQLAERIKAERSVISMHVV